MALTKLGEALAGLGQPAQAELEKAIEMFGDERSLYACEARFALARSLWSRPSNHPRALALAREARDGYQRLSDGKPKAAEVATWLAAHEGASSH